MSLSRQVAVKQDLKIEIPEDALGVQRWECEVSANDNVASMIKELNLKLPEGVDVDFRAGGYVQLEIPPYKMQWSTIDVQDEYREDWDKFNFWDLKSEVDEPTIRAYSMANYPEEKGIKIQYPRVAAAAAHGPFAAGRHDILRRKPKAG